MRMLTFAKRCTKEILRDPLNLAFGLGFPIALLLLLSAIQANAPVNLFQIEHLAPGICVFGLSFVTLFAATLVAKDRESALLQRLYTTPLTASDFITGYMLPMFPIAIMQSLITYFVAIGMGLQFSIEVIYGVLMVAPISAFYISLGLLCGSVLNVKAVGGVCGALLTNLSAWLSGVWFELELTGEFIVKIANALPFVHAVELERAVIAGEFSEVWPHLYMVLTYAVLATIGAVFLFLRQMRS